MRATIAETDAAAEPPAGTGDALQLVQAYEQARPRQLSARLVGDPATAEDVCHEAFVKAVQQWGDCDEAANARGWLYHSATHTDSDYLRRQRRVAMAPLTATHERVAITRWCVSVKWAAIIHSIVSALAVLPSIGLAVGLTIGAGDSHTGALATVIVWLSGLFPGVLVVSIIAVWVAYATGHIRAAWAAIAVPWSYFLVLMATTALLIVIAGQR